jgi:hypothetical protein
MIPRRVSTPTCERVLHGGTGVVAAMIGDEELDKGLLERGSRTHVIKMYFKETQKQPAHVIARYKIVRKGKHVPRDFVRKLETQPPRTDPRECRLVSGQSNSSIMSNIIP